MQLTIRTPPDFNFHRTVLSHGWCELLPFELDRVKWKLTRVLDLIVQSLHRGDHEAQRHPEA